MSTHEPFQLFPPLDPATEAALRASIERFGVLVPVVCDQHGRIIDGYHRHRIATELGVDHRTDVVEVRDDDHATELACTLNTDRRHLDPEQRRELAAELRSNGHSLRAIGGALGVDPATVHRDLAGVADATPDRVRGADGKSYPATRPTRDIDPDDDGYDDPDGEQTELDHWLAKGRLPPGYHLARDVEPGDVVTDDEGDTRLVADVEEIENEVVLHADDGEALIVGSDRELRITKPDLGGGISHPARYSDALLPILAAAVPPGEYPKVLDPFAGTGKIHQLPNDTVGVELEPEWAALHPDTICASALALPFRDGSFDAVVTSPTYGNRLADSHNASDPETRRSYTHDLGRSLHAENSGAMQWGPAYRDFHTAAWSEVWRVLRPGAAFVLNVKDHIRGGHRQLVAWWHVMALIGLGFVGEWSTDVVTPSLRQGDNAEARLVEQVFYLRKPLEVER